MATLAVKFVISVFLIAVAADLILCLRVFDAGKRNLRSFNQGRSLDVAKRSADHRREKRESGSSISESVQCIRTGGIVEERAKEEKFRTNFANEVINF